MKIRELIAPFTALWLTACGEPDKTDLINREKMLWNSMREVQLAAEHYAANHGDTGYPLVVNEAFRSYMTGGGDDGRTPRPVGFINPWTDKNEWPELGKFDNVEALHKGARPSIAPGKIIYTPIDNGTSYTIVAGTFDGKAMVDYNDEVLVLTNRSPYYTDQPSLSNGPDKKLNDPGVQ